MSATNRQRLILFFASLPCWAIFAFAFSGWLSDMREWGWVRKSVPVNVDSISFKHEYYNANGNQRKTTFRYTYSVNGRQFSAETNHLGPFVEHSVESNRIIERINKGLPVACFVRAGDPETAVLSREFSWLRWLMTVFFCGGFAFFGGVLLKAAFSQATT